MANVLNVTGDASISGTLRLGGSLSPTRARSALLSITELAEYVIPWTWWRVHDAYHTNLPGTAASDDLALIGGTFGSASPCIQGLDFGGTSTTAYARANIPLPWEYEDGQTVKLRFHAGILTTVADDSLTLDVVAYETDEEVGIGSDICATAAQSINSLTLADIDFTITATSLVAGDVLDVRIVVAGTDAGNLGVMIPVIGSAKLLCDVR